MTKEKKKQFSLTMLMRILLAVLVVVSIGVFANSIMRYNQLKEEERELNEILVSLRENIEELNELLDSGEQVQELLKNYAEYQDMINADPELAYTMEEIQIKRAELDALIQSSENREYIERIAKEQLQLFYPGEEIFYNDRNH